MEYSFGRSSLLIDVRNLNIATLKSVAYWIKIRNTQSITQRKQESNREKEKCLLFDLYWKRPLDLGTFFSNTYIVQELWINYLKLRIQNKEYLIILHLEVKWNTYLMKFLSLLQKSEVIYILRYKQDLYLRTVIFFLKTLIWKDISEYKI